jgi:hypothetical protein
MLGNNLLANIQIGSEKNLNIGFKKGDPDEFFLFQPEESAASGGVSTGKIEGGGVTSSF